MTVGEVEALDGRGVPDLFESPAFLRLSGRKKLALVLATALAVVGAAYAAATHYPVAGPPDGTELERRIVQVFGDPSVHDADDRVTGDLLIERFYILDLPTGDRYIADFLKGKIEAVQSVSAEGAGAGYLFLLDLKDMRRDRALYSAYVNEVSHPEETASGYYLGLIVPLGVSDAFALNYSGYLPPRRAGFRGPEEEDLQSFLLKQEYPKVTSAPRLIDVDGYNYLLSNSDAFPLFRNDFGLSRAIFVSELLVVDATSRTHRTAFYRLYDSFPPRVAGR